MANEATGKIGMKTTHPGHIKGTIGGTSGFTQIKEPDIQDTKPNGNQVSLDQELMKMSKNSLDYQTTTSIYRKMTEMMRNAMGGGR